MSLNKENKQNNKPRSSANPKRLNSFKNDKFYKTLLRNLLTF